MCLVKRAERRQPRLLLLPRPAAAAAAAARGELSLLPGGRAAGGGSAEPAEPQLVHPDVAVSEDRNDRHCLYSHERQWNIQGKGGVLAMKAVEHTRQRRCLIVSYRSPEARKCPSGEKVRHCSSTAPAAAAPSPLSAWHCSASTALLLGLVRPASHCSGSAARQPSYSGPPPHETIPTAVGQDPQPSTAAAQSRSVPSAEAVANPPAPSPSGSVPVPVAPAGFSGRIAMSQTVPACACGSTTKCSQLQEVPRNRKYHATGTGTRAQTLKSALRSNKTPQRRLALLMGAPPGTPV